MICPVLVLLIVVYGVGFYLVRYILSQESPK